MVTYIPKTPGLRHRKDIDYKGLGIYTGDPVEELSSWKKQNAGRNNIGRITVKGRGGGMRKIIRKVDFCRTENSHKIIKRIEYDPWRSGFLALVQDKATTDDPAKLTYILATAGMKEGAIVSSYFQGVPKMEDGYQEDLFVDGNCFKLKDIPLGKEICAIGLHPQVPKNKAQLCRGAGTFGILQSKGKKHKDELYAQVKLKSGEVRLIHENCVATIGRISNSNHHNCVIGKAGRNRDLGRMPKVRGVAMNAVDHPHGTKDLYRWW